MYVTGGEIRLLVRNTGSKILVFPCRFAGEKHRIKNFCAGGAPTLRACVRASRTVGMRLIRIPQVQSIWEGYFLFSGRHHGIPVITSDVLALVRNLFRVFCRLPPC